MTPSELSEILYHHWSPRVPDRFYLSADHNPPAYVMWRDSCDDTFVADVTVRSGRLILDYGIQPTQLNYELADPTGLPRLEAQLIECGLLLPEPA